MDYFYNFILDLFQYIFGEEEEPSFIPDQSFSLPYPIIRHLLTKGYIGSQIKLFKSCKLFRNHFRKVRGFQVENLTISRIVSRKSPDDYYIHNDSLHLRIFFFNDYYKKFLGLKTKQLKCYHHFDVVDDDYDKSFVFKIFHTLDFSILQELSIRFHTIDEKVLLPFLVPSLISLELTFANVQHKNILEVILSKATNLKKLKCTWQEITNPLKNVNKIIRSTKLNVLRFRGVVTVPVISDVADFIIHHMEPTGKLEFISLDRSVESPFKYEKEIRYRIKSKISASDYDNFTVLAKFDRN